jgi:hypothetical protein
MQTGNGVWATESSASNCQWMYSQSPSAPEGPSGDPDLVTLIDDCEEYRRADL